MATTDQKYLDVSLFTMSRYISKSTAIPIVIIDPATNTYQGVASSVIDDFVSGGAYTPIVIIDPNTGNATT